MIKKLEQIKNLAVFKDFNWDHEVLKADSSIAEFQHINILYGRNYCGKTTLSRILRAIQTGALSDKYDNPEFKVKLSDGTEITEINYKSSQELIRVFNEDFVRENLKFIVDPDADIESFALLGEDKIKIEEEIKPLKKELGSNKVGEETGLYAQLISANKLKDNAINAVRKAESSLDSQLKDKATNNPKGIRYKAHRFGDQNYNKPKLEADIKTVLSDSYTFLSDEQIKEYEDLIEEKVKEPIVHLQEILLKFTSLSSETKVLLTKKVGEADKIEELIKDAVLNRWVKEGREHHRNKRKTCAFCGNTISEDRWSELDKHFDEASVKLENDIDALLIKIEQEENSINKGFEIKKELFYAKYQPELEKLVSEYERDSKLYIIGLQKLREQLTSRKADIINPIEYKELQEHSDKLQKIWDSYEILRQESNEFTSELGKSQDAAKISLRLNEVRTFADTIKYSEIVQNIGELKNNLVSADNDCSRIIALIKEKETLIKAKMREMNDEEKGAVKVNEYLTNFFGHKFLSLESKERIDDISGEKVIYFQVMRNGHKAFNLSEGECSLLAFCYFLAKLEDVDTIDKKPIIWIDDPISSLDSNHVFFVYSLLSAEIVLKGNFEQLFISTHNLDFLKYLKRLNGNFKSHNGNNQNYNKQYFIIERAWEESSIKIMPKYLKEYVTEFNHLFHQIYKCSEIDSVTDDNYQNLYNFPNNARKFLEIYMCYKYPYGGANETNSLEKQKKNLIKFFGDQEIPVILTTRINNEYSHLAGCFERGALPIDIPEIKQAAIKIIDCLKKDPEQFSAFLSSIGVTPPEMEQVQEAEVTTKQVKKKTKRKEQPQIDPKQSLLFKE